MLYTYTRLYLELEDFIVHWALLEDVEECFWTFY